MAATTGQVFLDLLEDILARASMSNSELAYYSFRPKGGETEFIYNDLYSTGNMFLQKVSGVVISDYGSGYCTGEYVNVNFTSFCAGTGASGTGLIITINDSGTMLRNGLIRAYTFNATGTDLIGNGNFSNNETGWYGTYTESQLPSYGGGYEFIDNKLKVVYDLDMMPNSGELRITGECFYWGSLDVISGANPDYEVQPLPSWMNLVAKNSVGTFQLPSKVYLDTGSISGISGTVYFGGYLPQDCEFTVAFYLIGSYKEFWVDNFKFYTGNNVFRDEVGNNDYFAFQSDSTGNYICSYNGKNEMGLAHRLVDGSPLNTDQSIPITYLPIINSLDTWGECYTISFWHKYVPGYSFNSEFANLVTFPNFSLQVRDGYYGLLCNVYNTYLESNVLATASGWHNFQVNVYPTRIDNESSEYNVTRVTLTIDNKNFFTNIQGTLTDLNWATTPNGTYSRFIVYGASDANLYETYFDELYIWNRNLKPQEKAAIYNAGSGYFYSFASLPSNAYGVISGIDIKNSGLYYSKTPKVIISAPTGGGLAASGYATLTPDFDRINADNFPAFSVGNTNYIISSMTGGTGYFTEISGDFLRVGNNISSNDWTVIFNVTPTGYRSTGSSNVLLSTMDSVNQKSGLIFGINDANRLFFEYIDVTHSLGGQRRIHVLNQEIGDNNLVGISTDSRYDTITLAHLDIAERGIFGFSYYCPGYQHCNKMYLFGFPNDTNNTKYTGFFGQAKDVVILSGAANVEQMNALAPLFCISGYAPASQSGIYTYYPIVTGASFSSGVTSYGITGYSISTVTIPDKDGTNITAYATLPQYGNISGNTIVYSSGTVSGVYLTYSGVPESLSYNHVYTRNFADSNFVMLKNEITTGDLVEIYSFTDKQPGKISILPEAFNIYDFYLSDNFDSNQANVYYNGLLQVTGIDYVLESGKIVSSNLFQYKSNFNYLLYDEITGITTTSGWTGYIGQYTFPQDPTSNGKNDVYLNGQKLVSGIDYVYSGTTIVLTGVQNGSTVEWVSGIWAFAPSRTENRNVFTGSGLGYWHNFDGSLGRLMDEMVFLNGQRLAPTIDYLAVSSRSLLNTDYRSSSLSFGLYSGDLLSVDVLTGRPNLSNPVNEPKVPMSVPTVRDIT